MLSTLVPLLAIVTMAALGVWQLNRAEQKQQRLEQIAAKSQLQALTLEQLDNSFDDIRDIPLRVSGQFHQEQYYLLDNKTYQGKVGYQVIAKFIAESGTLLVNLGWVEGNKDRSQLPTIALPDRPLAFKGLIAIPELNPWVSETATTEQSWPKRIQQLDIDLMQSWQPDEPMLSFVLLVSPDQPVGFVRDWQPVVMPPEKHQAYALQWFGLSLAGLIILFFVKRKQTSD